MLLIAIIVIATRRRLSNLTRNGLSMTYSVSGYLPGYVCVKHLLEEVWCFLVCLGITNLVTLQFLVEFWNSLMPTCKRWKFVASELRG